ncbi:hypothetical protein AGMMS50289_04120 [Betaproteobacteria bacterium]|nr:hypothetical protein AGMMS50289_04120 [Betaproteobacteria bacterium]
MVNSVSSPGIYSAYLEEPWEAGYASRVGKRHQARGGGNEDSIAVSFLPVPGKFALAKSRLAFFVALCPGILLCLAFAGWQLTGFAFPAFSPLLALSVGVVLVQVLLLGGLFAVLSAPCSSPPQSGLHCCVADGVSGGACGAVASLSAAHYLVGLRPAYPESEAEDFGACKAALEQWIVAADEVVEKKVAEQGDRAGATTFSAAWLSPTGDGWISRLGDCRVWCWKMDEKNEVQLYQVGGDQTFTAMNETPEPNVSMSNPARLLGVGLVGEPDVWDVHLASGEGLMLTSDGIHATLSSEEIAGLLQACLRHDRKRRRTLCTTARLIERRARMSGSRDDLSVMILRRR